MSDGKVPPWMRGRRAGGESSAGGGDAGRSGSVGLGFEPGCISRFIDHCIPCAEGKGFRFGVVIGWAVFWLAWLMLQTGMQVWWMFSTRDVGMTGTWFLQMAGITMSSERWFVAVVPAILGFVIGPLGWLLAGVTGWLRVAVVSDFLILQSFAGMIGSGVARLMLYEVHGGDGVGLVDSFTGRSGALAYGSSFSAVMPGLVAAGIALLLGVPAVLAGVGDHRGRALPHRFRVGVTSMTVIGLWGLLIVDWLSGTVVAGWVLAILAAIMLVWWIPGEARSIRRCVDERRSGAWQCQAGMFLVMDFMMLALVVFASAYPL